MMHIDKSLHSFNKGCVVTFEWMGEYTIGHVIGFDLNSTREVIVLVEHPGQLPGYVKQTLLHHCKLTKVS